MTNRTARISLILLACSALWTTGCTTAAKQAFHELRGAKADILFVDKTPQSELDRYQSVELTPVTTTLGDRLCPSSLRRAYDRCARELSGELEDVYTGDEPGLTIDSEIEFFQSKGLLSGALLLVRVKMHAEDRLVGDALVVAESKSFREGGGHDLAEVAVETLGEYLKRGEPTDADE